jgi:hypothetical protein
MLKRLLSITRLDTVIVVDETGAHTSSTGGEA